MVISSSFKKLCSYFFQDIGLTYPDPKDWIPFALRHVNETDKKEIKNFLDELFERKPENKELQSIWFSTDAEVSFPHGDDLRNFLKEIRKNL
jgi:hypothetical protein